MDSFAAPACPNQSGSQRSRANNTREQQLRLLLEATEEFVSNLDFRDLLQAISSKVRRVIRVTPRVWFSLKCPYRRSERALESGECSRGSR